MRIHQPQTCPKCGWNNVFRVRYLARGAMAVLPDQGDYQTLGSVSVAHGPILIRWCPECDYSYTEKPVDERTLNVEVR